MTRARYTVSVRIRRAALLVHRYVGLAMASFLIVAGLTGTMMAFYTQLDAWLNPELLVAARPPDGRPPLDPFALREKLLAQLSPEQVKEVRAVDLHVVPDRTVNYWVDGRETFVDPYTGQVVGSRKFGDLSEGKKNLLTFLYEVHFSLALGEVGRVAFGVVALLWTVDCFVGAYLTFPAPSHHGAARRRSWFARWLPAWLLKTSKLFSLVFTWHRASGLWFWLMFFVFAWSSVGLNLAPVYEPVMHAVFGEGPPEPFASQPELTPPRESPKIAFRDALARGRALMAAEAAQRRFEILGERYLDYQPARGAYGYTVESTLDVSERLAETTLVFDGDTGERIVFDAPTGLHTGGTVSSWLIALHFGAVREGGLVYRAFVCLMGASVVLLSVSGVWIWWKKWRGKRQRSERDRAP